LLHTVRCVALLLALTFAATSSAQKLSAEPSDAQLIDFFAGESVQTVKCGTPQAAELQARGLTLPTLDLALAEGDTLVYDTPEGHFQITYAVTGLAAVDPTDEDMTGVPDWVELTGRAFERSWSVQIDSLGFPAPDLGGGRYQVSLLSRTTSYFAVTWIRPGSPGGSEIDIRYSMVSTAPGFCDPGGDPDCAVNLQLATIAHEFKHAIQVAAGWNLFQLGGDWIELDATWIEDLVFDDSNDYYRYLELGITPFTSPTTSLATENNYRHCTWQHYLGETHGQDFMVDLSEQIAAGPVPQYAQNAYLAVANDRGLDWVGLWREYTEANYLSGERHTAGRGFAEGAAYPTSAIVSIDSLPQAEVFSNLADMSMRFHHFDATVSDATGAVDIVFEGSADRGWTLLAVFQRPDETRVIPVPLTDGTANFRTAAKVEDYDSFAVLVGNSRVPLTLATNGSYRLTLGLRVVDTAPESVGRFKGRFRRGSGN
jgi:hypothetical protein